MSGLSEVFERQRGLIRQLGKDMDRLVEVFGKIKALAKPQLRKTKSYVSPYAKFDKYHKKKKRK